MNIPSCIVTFPATTARKTFFGTPTQPVQICELAIYVLEEKKTTTTKKKIIHFRLKITMFYCENLNYWPGSINLMFQYFKNLAIPTF